MLLSIQHHRKSVIFRQVPLQKIGLTTTCKRSQEDDSFIGLHGFEIEYRPNCGKTFVVCDPDIYKNDVIEDTPK